MKNTETYSYNESTLTPLYIDALEKWLNSIPDDVYEPCPCGCGKKFRYVIKGGEKELDKHFLTFLKNQSND